MAVVAKREDNLIPVTQRSKEEAKKIQTSGGIARGKQRTQKKTLKECAQLLMSLDVKDKQAINILKSAGVDEDNYTNGMLATVSMLEQAIAGNTNAYKIFMEACSDDKANTDEQEQEHDNLISAIKKAVDDED